MKYLLMGLFAVSVMLGRAQSCVVCSNLNQSMVGSYIGSCQPTNLGMTAGDYSATQTWHMSCSDGFPPYLTYSPETITMTAHSQCAGNTAAGTGHWGYNKCPVAFGYGWTENDTAWPYPSRNYIQATNISRDSQVVIVIPLSSWCVWAPDYASYSYQCQAHWFCH